MKEERVWKIGPTWESIYDVFTQTLQLVEECPNVYLASDFLETANVSKQDWDLDEDDEFFAYMEEENFKGLQPFDPMDDPMDPIITYDMLEPPSSDPPRKVWELEDCAARIAAWFSKLRKCKVSEDGVGIAWPDTPGTWRPRERFKYEYDLYSGSILTVPFQISAAHYTGYDPHHVYHAWFGDDCQDGGVLRSEVQILVGCIRSQMRLYYLCEYNFPVLMLSVHGTKARVMIANFNLDTMKLDLKCSKFQQCDGFERIKGEQEVTEQEDSEQKDSEQEDTVVRARPDDFNSKRDLFFGWLNPICKGDTYLVDAGEGPGMVLPRKAPARSPSTDSSESLS